MKKSVHYFLAVSFLCSTNIVFGAASSHSQEQEKVALLNKYIGLNGRNAYAVFNLPTDASDRDITIAYRQLSRLLHPDRNPDHKELADAAFKVVGAAYDKIKSPGADREREKHAFASGSTASSFSFGFRPASAFARGGFGFDMSEIDEWLKRAEEESKPAAKEREENENPRIKDSKQRVLAEQEKNAVHLKDLPKKKIYLSNEAESPFFVLITYGGNFRVEAKLKDYLNRLIKGEAEEALLPLIAQAEEELGKSYPVTVVTATEAKFQWGYMLEFPDAEVPLRIRVWPSSAMPQDYQLRDNVFGTPDDAKKGSVAAAAVNAENAPSLESVTVEKSPSGKIDIKLGYNK